MGFISRFRYGDQLIERLSRGEVGRRKCRVTRVRLETMVYLWNASVDSDALWGLWSIYMGSMDGTLIVDKGTVGVV